MISFPFWEEAALFSDRVEAISIVGTIHDHRHRWNPFTEENEMTRSANSSEWVKWLELSKHGGRHQDGIYSFRFIINHNPKRLLKLDHWSPDNIDATPIYREQCLTACLGESKLGREYQNFTIHVQQDCEACLVVDHAHMSLQINYTTPNAITYINQTRSVQINGFIWDSLDMFNKFDEHGAGREMQQVAEYIWEKKIPLSTKGGIDFRSDGVYQFLVSTNGDEDQGYGAVNHHQSITPSVMDLVPGTGFGSSHGTSYHSAPTAKVLDDDIYTITVLLAPGNEQLKIEGVTGGRVEIINNQANGIQLLGDIHTTDSFDPTTPQTQMNSIDSSEQLFEKFIDLDQGSYSINFAIGSELFLDTMGLGCWLKTNGSSIRGIGWHGKPNEYNIGFKVLRNGKYRFTYDRGNDIFSIEACDSRSYNSTCLEAVTSINTLSVVGNMPSPLIEWDPKADENLMVSLGRGRFEKTIDMAQGIDYQFKLVGNQSNWQIVFADYELDGYGLAYNTNNPDPYNSRLEDLRIHGHLTTHGNPPPIHFVPSVSGLHRVMVDLWTGAYGIKRL
jgi:hypothetical protein